MAIVGGLRATGRSSMETPAPGDGFCGAGHLRTSLQPRARLWGGRPRPQPAPWPAPGAREVLRLPLTGGPRGTRADQGVCPTGSAPLLPNDAAHVAGPVVLTVHDEIVIEHLRITKGAIEEIMKEPPRWAEDLELPIAVEAWVGKRYRK